MERYVTIDAVAWPLYGDGTRDKPYNVGASKRPEDLVEDLLNEPGFKETYFVWGSSIFNISRSINPETSEFDHILFSHTGRMVRSWRDGINEEIEGSFRDYEVIKATTDTTSLIKAIVSNGIDISDIEFLV